MKKATCCRRSHGSFSTPTTLIIIGQRIFPALFRALADKSNATASMRNVLDAPAILLIGSDPTYQHPLLAWQIRNNVRLHRSRLYLINARPIKLTSASNAFRTGCWRC